MAGWRRSDLPRLLALGLGKIEVILFRIVHLAAHSLIPGETVGADLSARYSSKNFPDAPFRTQLFASFIFFWHETLLTPPYIIEKNGY